MLVFVPPGVVPVFPVVFPLVVWVFVPLLVVLPLVPGATVPSPHGWLVAFWHASGIGATWARWFAERLPFTKVGLLQAARLADGFLTCTPVTAPPWAFGPSFSSWPKAALTRLSGSGE